MCAPLRGILGRTTGQVIEKFPNLRDSRAVLGWAERTRAEREVWQLYAAIAALGKLVQRNYDRARRIQGRTSKRTLSAAGRRKIALPGIVEQWFVTALIKTPGHAPADSLVAASLLNQL